MIRRLYVNNFRCLQNFELNTDAKNNVFIFGKNGSGKSTIINVMRIFQKIGQGQSSLDSLIDDNDYTFGYKYLPMKFELEVSIDDKIYVYKLGIEFPPNFEKPRVKSEILEVNSETILEREEGQTSLNDSAHFLLDWHHVGIPLVNTKTQDEPLSIFKKYLKENILILSPIPELFVGIADLNNHVLDQKGANIVGWISKMLSSKMFLYTELDKFLKDKMLDFNSIYFEDINNNQKKMYISFNSEKTKKIILEIEQLSNGEKMFILFAMLVAIHKLEPNKVCLWDEPDNYLGMHEIEDIMTSLSKSTIEGKSQIIVASHNDIVFDNFSSDEMLFVSRESHSHPTRIKRADELKYESDSVIEAYFNGELN